MADSGKRVCLAWEAAELGHAVEAAQLLLDAVRHDELGQAGDAEAAPRAVSAVLGLVRQRLDIVAQATDARVDPLALLTRENAVEAATPLDEGVVALTPWSVRERLTRTQSEVERLTRRLHDETNTHQEQPEMEQQEKEQDDGSEGG